MTTAEHSGDRVSDPLRVAPFLTLGVQELSWRFSRSSGPGGQGVNTADSRVELSWNPASSAAFSHLSPALQARFWMQIGPALVNGEVTVAASEFRAQLRNREAARKRLAQIIARAFAPPSAPRRATRPSRGAVERRLAGKRARGQTKAGRTKPLQD
ncbi:aminoacyl-tRNA hydrolase [Nakamurella antarctica]|uniref:Aminoacyl-tRNA hydrolase n=1 Tax=Nakamurella antarctica TaxID=1902245 RepID=A0A3G8ZKI6_9ACTN|nr:alternative ribosome rescue aminoacyl-tRNA hydrolase ArfB [Nakamurella antarctica]AZI57297.1 aminoacyl-tRNA hydrolase [Nakamurella antarctica]